MHAPQVMATIRSRREPRLLTATVTVLLLQLLPSDTMLPVQGTSCSAGYIWGLTRTHILYGIQHGGFIYGIHIGVN